MSMNMLKKVESIGMRENAEEFRVGDTLKVHYKIIEGKTERIQAFEGLCIAMKNTGIRKAFTVRKISYGVGVERTFFIHSPKIAKIEVVRLGKVRRAKLFFVRDKVGKEARIKERRVKK
jgi:large subunit ribosomal protein L19